MTAGSATTSPQEALSPRAAVIEAGVVYLMAASVAILISFSTSFAHPFTDLFHEGEYLASRLYFGPGAGTLHPLLIHGAMDYVPAQIGSALCSADRMVVCVRGLNATVTALTSFLFAGCALAIARGRHARLMTGIAVLLVLLLINGRGGGSPALREAALFTEIWCLIAASQRRGRAADLLAFAAGLAAGLGIFWAYNRGLTGVGAIPIYGAAALYAGRGRRHASAAAAGLAAGLLVLLINDPAMFAQHLFNIRYWAANASMWDYSPDLRRTVSNLPFYAAAAALVLAALWTAWRSYRAGRRDELAITLVLLLVFALTVQQSMGRDDLEHLTFTEPAGVLLLAQLVAVARPAPAVEAGWGEIFRRRAMLLVAMCGMLLIDFYSEASITREVVFGAARNLKAALTGWPTDRALTAPETLRIADTLRAADARCTYALNNAGGLYHLSGLKPCSTIMYPVYSSRAEEPTIIADLARERPPLIIGRSNDWFAAIDNKDLVQRTPRLAAWIAVHYPTVRRIGETEIRYLATTPPH